MSTEEKKPESDFTPASWKIRVDGTIYTFENPEPPVRDVLVRIGKDPSTHVLIFIIPGEDKRLLAPDDNIDLRQPGIEEFTFASTLREFEVYVDETRIVFKEPVITGLDLLQAVGKKPCRYAVTQILVGVDDQFIDPDEKVDLRRAGIERFTIVQKDDVNIFIEHDGNRQSVTVRRGKMSVEAIKKAGQVPGAYTLYVEQNGSPMPLDNTTVLDIQGCEEFVTQVNSGAAS